MTSSIRKLSSMSMAIYGCRRIIATPTNPLGASAIAADQGNSPKELHVVYASPGTIAAYRKETAPSGEGGVSGGYRTDDDRHVSHAQTLKGWFVLVRDSKDIHPGNKLWGDGWGWSWFDASNPTKTTSTDYKVDCLGCHVPARATEWIYVNDIRPSSDSANLLLSTPNCGG